MKVDVVYALSEQAIVTTYHVAVPATVADVLRLVSGDAAYEGIDVTHAACGVFGRMVDANHVLEDGDRIELYRPLPQDPKTARRARVRQDRRQRKAGAR